jgi:hypothetical protein
MRRNKNKISMTEWQAIATVERTVLFSLAKKTLTSTNTKKTVTDIIDKKGKHIGQKIEVKTTPLKTHETSAKLLLTAIKDKRKEIINNTPLADFKYLQNDIKRVNNHFGNLEYEATKTRKLAAAQTNNKK